MKYMVLTQNHGQIGGVTAKISMDDGVTWIRLTKHVGGGLVSFDNVAQAMREASKEARRISSRRQA